MVFSFLKRQKKKKGQCSPLYTGNQFHVDNYRNILLLLSIYIALWWLEIASVEILWQQIPIGSFVYGSVKVINFFFKRKNLYYPQLSKEQ